MIEIKIEPEDIQEKIAELQSGLEEQLSVMRKQVADLLQNSLKAHVPVRTGALRDSLRFEDTGNTSVLWGKYYGRYVITGTKPHDIYPVHAKVLHFYWEKIGKEVFLAHVHHPGTKANDFRKPAIDEIDLQEVTSKIVSWIREQVE
ncbi:hypothetical protein Tsac_2855 [Thermoanaerobacterium phage THSA-485A]|uniref:hypothetical protein n=1 Tax=Thermoanaerobacterium phage THSA-485A TaxID=1126885 RepID=UPI000263F840|nr:hypothetical protein Tsac_2855 [Thermoanaerobacterium phage THSA-485A]AFK87708.1 hypothetical protein Tsac_2855 [Thermoanaerobacterium phage THSA-485A]